MIQIFLVCFVLLVADDCYTIHPDLTQLIPNMDPPSPPLKSVDLDILQCRDMYYNNSLMHQCYQQFGAEIDPL